MLIYDSMVIIKISSNRANKSILMFRLGRARPNRLVLIFGLLLIYWTNMDFIVDNLFVAASNLNLNQQRA